jgi:chemotaxis protein MotB
MSYHSLGTSHESRVTHRIMARRRPHEEHVNHEAWAIPYGDLITLLLAFFVVMYAMSTLNEGKYRVLSEALNAEFQGPQKSTAPIQMGDPQRGQTQHASAIAKKALLEGTSTPLTAAPVAHSDTAKDPAQDPAYKPQMTSADIATGTTQQLNQVAGDIEQAMSALIREKMVTVRRHGLWVEVEIQTDILFPSGVATLSPLATSMLSPLADSLQPFSNPIRVEGHTDNVPIGKRDRVTAIGTDLGSERSAGASWPSNWELSAARAASVVRLFVNRAIDPTRLTVVGLGEYRPLQSNATAAGRNANRRVVLVILGNDNMPVDMKEQQETHEDHPASEVQSKMVLPITAPLVTPAVSTGG